MHLRRVALRLFVFSQFLAFNSLSPPHLFERGNILRSAHHTIDLIVLVQYGRTPAVEGAIICSLLFPDAMY